MRFGGRGLLSDGSEDTKEYLEGVLDRIEVRLDDETNDHQLDITFKMG